ncbi:MAG: hypothetical protein WCP16_17610, partial [Pseudanabaena sp. ELA645]
MKILNLMLVSVILFGGASFSPNSISAQQGQQTQEQVQPANIIDKILEGLINLGQQQIRDQNQQQGNQQVQTQQPQTQQQGNQQVQ